jgi:hypothetical protein
MRDFEFTSSDGSRFVISYNINKEILVKRKTSPFNTWYLLTEDILPSAVNISYEAGKEILDFMNRVLKNKVFL